MIREERGDTIYMVLIFSAYDIPREGTLSFLAGEIPRIERNWELDFIVSRVAVLRLAKE